MKKHDSMFFMALVLFLTLITVGCQKSDVQAAKEESSANPQATNTPPVWDRDFLEKIQAAEIRQGSLSREALQRAYGADIQRYARMVVDDHTRTVQQLNDVMAKKGVGQPGLSTEAQAEGTYRLDNLSGADFDREYIVLMAAETEQTLGWLRQAAETADDRDVRAYASAVLPVYEREQRKAADLVAKFSKQQPQ